MFGYNVLSVHLVACVPFANHETATAKSRAAPAVSTVTCNTQSTKTLLAFTTCQYACFFFSLYFFVIFVIFFKSVPVVSDRAEQNHNGAWTVC